VHLKISSGVNGISLNLICEEIYKIVKMSQAKKMRERIDDDDEDLNVSNISISAADFYETIVLLKPRLLITVSVFNLVPESVKKLEGEDHPTDQFNLDLRAIHASLDLLAPSSGTGILDDVTRRSWASKVVSLSTYFKQMEGLLAKEEGVSKDDQMIKSARQKCQRLEIFKLFLDHTLKNDLDLKIKQSICNNYKLLWFAIKEPDFKSSAKTFTNILDVIDNYCRRAGEILLDQTNQECLLCLEAIAEPVVLPCGHVGCQNCIQNYISTNSNCVCPMDSCTQKIPPGFSFTCADKTKKGLRSHSDFKKMLTHFFIELLQLFVFERESSPHAAIVDQLLSFVVTKKLPKDRTKPRTKSLSSFRGDNIDSRPVIRSLILQLLLRYDIRTIESNLQKYINEMEPFVGQANQLPELCVMIVQCLEDGFLIKEKKNSNSTTNKINSALQHMESDRDRPGNLVKALCQTANDRLAMNTVAECINKHLSGEEALSATELFDTAIRFVSSHAQHKNLQKYLVRVIATKYQIGAIVQWKKRGIFLDLLPDDLKNVTNNESPDMFLMIDNYYKIIRDTLKIAWISNNYEQLTVLGAAHGDKQMVWALAIHHLTKVNPIKIKDPSAFDAFMHQHNWLTKIWTENQESTFRNLVGGVHTHMSILNLLIHFKEVISGTQLLQFLNIFRELSKNPKNCTQIFFPTMPHDETLEAKNAVKDATTWHACPCGIVYAIGNCGQPWEKASCPSCKKPIGGQGHKFAGQRRDANLMEFKINDCTRNWRSRSCNHSIPASLRHDARLSEISRRYPETNRSAASKWKCWRISY